MARRRQRLSRPRHPRTRYRAALETVRRGKVKAPITRDELEKRGIKALMASMWSGAKEPKSLKDYEETYIHSKVAIVDDGLYGWIGQPERTQHGARQRTECAQSGVGCRA